MRDFLEEVGTYAFGLAILAVPAYIWRDQIKALAMSLVQMLPR